MKKLLLSTQYFAVRIVVKRNFGARSAPGIPRYAARSVCSIVERMKIIAIEEHFVIPALQQAWLALPESRQDLSLGLNAVGTIADLLVDTAGERIRAMDEAGIDVHVLSLTAPGTQNLNASDAVRLAREANDAIAEAVRQDPERFEGFATLPTPDPHAAAEELHRAVETLHLKGALVYGRTGERNMDLAEFDPIYEAAARLRVPLYLHPQSPLPAVRDAYYSGFSPEIDVSLATTAIGWHFESGMQLLRLILAGTFDRHPNLQLIVGHWGEVVLFYLERIERLEMQDLKLERPLREYFRTNVSYTPSGMFSQRYLQATIDVVGVDRILFSTDYPYLLAPNGGACAFLDASTLSQADKEKIAHGNWNRMTNAARIAGVA